MARGVCLAVTSVEVSEMFTAAFLASGGVSAPPYLPGLGRKEKHEADLSLPGIPSDIDPGTCTEARRLRVLNLGDTPRHCIFVAVNRCEHVQF